MLLFMRHAESEANIKDQLASRIDVALSHLGCKQARRIADRLLSHYTPTLLVTSPLKRARQTIEPIADRLGMDPLIREELTEQNLGKYSGMTYSEAAREPDYQNDRSKRWNWVPEGGGESYAMIAERLHPFFSWLDGIAESRIILIVTHAVTMRIIRGFLENTLPVYPENIATNGEIWKLSWKESGYPHKIETLFMDDVEMPRHGE